MRRGAAMKRAALALAVLAALLAVSCAHQSVLAPEGFWFQRLAREGAAVLTTTDPALMARAAALPDFAQGRLKRLSLLMEEERFIALVECDLGRGLFVSAMAVSQEWNKSPEGDCYTDSSGALRLNLLQDGLVLITDGSYAEARALVEDSLLKAPLIDDGTAALMAASDTAFHTRRPRKLPSLSIIPRDATLQGIDEIVVRLAGGVLDMRASFDTEDLRRSFCMIFKLNYVAILKRSGAKVDVSLLRERIAEEGRSMAASGLLIPPGESERLFGI